MLAIKGAKMEILAQIYRAGCAVQYIIGKFSRVLAIPGLRTELRELISPRFVGRIES